MGKIQGCAAGLSPRGRVGIETDACGCIQIRVLGSSKLPCSLTGGPCSGMRPTPLERHPFLGPRSCRVRPPHTAAVVPPQRLARPAPAPAAGRGRRKPFQPTCIDGCVVNAFVLPRQEALLHYVQEGSGCGIAKAWH